ncbi:MAG TPA: alpha/beta fold hydrolase, partial [Blastocatellia bacterium]|nr:alpha/beta fold hydrolase [Blastocatellia bacterium]
MAIPNVTARVIRLFKTAGAIVTIAGFAIVAAGQTAVKNTSQTRGGDPKLKLEPCEIPSLKETGRCGKYEVYEDRQAKSGRKISLNILVLPARTASPKPDPVFYLEGGPGASAVSAAKSGVFQSLVNKWRTERDAVFVDQRGTGESNPLKCDFDGDPDDMSPYFTSVATLANLPSCRDKLEKVADLTLYTTPIAMDDLDEVRQALGYDKINIYGGSYGTRAGLVYLRQHGDHVRTAALDGVAPTNCKLPLAFSKGVQHSLDRLFADCLSDETCHKAFPDVRADLAAALEKLDKGPITTTAYNTIKKRPEVVPVSRGVFMEMVRLLLYDPGLSRYLPIVLHQSAQGQLGGLTTLGFGFEHQVRGLIDGGMEMSVICSEDAPFISEDDIKQATGGTYYGDWRTRVLLKACKDWPRGKLPSGYEEPVKSNVPVLMVSGDLDPVTPPWIGTDAARSLTHSRQIIGRNWSHSSMSDCITGMIADFVHAGTLDGLDASCAEKATRPPFMTNGGARAPSEHPAGTVKTSYEGTIEAGAQKIR